MLKTAGIPGKYFYRRSFSTWDVLLPTEEIAKKLATSNITTKYFRLQPEYRGQRRFKVTVCNVSMQLNGDIIAAYLSSYGGVEDYTQITSAHVRNALPLRDLHYKAGLADMPDFPRGGCGLEETAEHAFYYCERVRPFWDHVGEWTARIEPKKLVLLDVGYVVDNVLPPFQGEKRMVFLAILAVARMVIWTTRNKVLYDDANFSHRDLVLYFRHQLRVKIRCDR